MKSVVAAGIWLSVAWAQNCVPVAALHPGDSTQGALSEANCRLSDGSLFAEYIITFSTTGQLRVTVSSNDFPAAVTLRDSLGHKVNQGASIGQTVERGEYSILVNAAAPGNSGNFQLMTAFDPEPNTLCRNLTHIGLNQSISGSLGTSSCPLPNAAWHDQYRLTSLGAGTVEITADTQAFPPLIVLRGDDGHALGADAQHLVVPIAADEDHTVVVASTQVGAGGSYNLSVKFTPADDETCRSQQVLNGSGDSHGTVSDSSCSFSPDLHYNYYDLVITGPGLADLRLTNTDLGGPLALLDQSGRVLAVDYDSGGLRKPVLRQQLAPATYTVLVISPRPGDYTLAYRFTPGLPENCPVLSLDNGTVVPGSLSGDGSCRLRDVIQDLYRITVPAPGGAVDLTMSSPDFDGIVILRDAKDNTMLEVDGADLKDVRLATNLPAGTYAISAGATRPGNYTLSYRFTPGNLPACPSPQPIVLDGGYIGILGASSCRGSDGQTVDFYQFTIPGAGTVAAIMTSSDLASLLTLTDTNGIQLRQDAGSYGASDSLVIQYLPAGTYRLGARSALGGQSGRYRLDVRFVGGDRPPGCQSLRQVNQGDSVNGSLYITSCQFLDDTFSDIYQLNIADTTGVDIGLNSDAFDAYLELLDENGSVVTFDDNSGGGTNARIATTLGPGTYYIVAKPYVDQHYVAGAYTLTVN